MKCYKHTGVNATATCQSCGKSLCNECADRFSIIECEGCLVKNNSSYARSLKSLLVLSAVLFVGIFILWFWMLNSVSSLDTTTKQSLPFGKVFLYSLWAAYQAGSIPFGWKLLNKINFGTWFVSLRLIPVLWLLKIAVSVVIGIFATPFMLFKSIRELKEIDGLKRSIDSGSIVA